MRPKEFIGQVEESIRVFVEDLRDFGIEEALFQQYLRGRYPQVRLLNQEGEAICEGLLLSLKKEYYTIRERVEHGYGHGSNPFREDTRIETKDGIRLTPEIFKELVEAKAGKGYLEDLERGKVALMQSVLQSPDIPEETRERLVEAIEDAKDRKS